MEENKSFIQKTIKFFCNDIWKITEVEISRSKQFLYNIVKVLYISGRGFIEDRLSVKASALTYYTLFAMVPILALIMAIGRGLGMQDLILNVLSAQMGNNVETINYLMQFVNKYLEHARGGIFVGIGIVALLWSVRTGFAHVEDIFNDIWQVKKSRPIVAQFTIYFSILLVVPVLLVLSGTTSVFFMSKISQLYVFDVVGPTIRFFIKLIPYALNWLLFTGIFILIPNTRVKFIPSLIAGVFTGTVFQILQILYIQGQINLSSYNAVYGSFAIIPLLLFWIQLSWLVILIGAKLSFAVQNISQYEYESNTKDLTHQYEEFLLLSIMTLIVKQFLKEDERNLSAENISKENKIPLRLVNKLLNQLEDSGLICNSFNEAKMIKTYVPAIDVHKISVSMVLNKINTIGKDHLKFHEIPQFVSQWEILNKIKSQIEETDGSKLLMDL